MENDVTEVVEVIELPPKKRPGDRTSLARAAKLVNLVASGQSARRAGKMVGMSPSTAKDIIAGRNGWAQIKLTKEFLAHRQSSSIDLELLSGEAAKQALVRMGETVGKSSYGQAVYGFGVSVDKFRLFAGQSTQNLSVKVSERIEGLDAALAKLDAALKIKSQRSRENASSKG